MTQHDIQILEEGCMSNLKKGSHLISVLELHHEITSQEPWNPAGALLEPFPGAHLPELKKKKKVNCFLLESSSKCISLQPPRCTKSTSSAAEEGFSYTFNSRYCQVEVILLTPNTSAESYPNPTNHSILSH